MTSSYPYSILFCIVSFVLLVSFGCNSSASEEGNHQHLELFGFVLVDTHWDDPTDNDLKTNYLDEISSFSNIADILVVNSSDDIRLRIDVFKVASVKPIIHISELFFELVGTDGPSGSNYNLRVDYKSRWDQFLSVNNLPNLSKSIGCLYLGEEPTWNDISFEELKAASDYIKSTVDDIPIMIIEAHPMLEQLEIPISVDWYGFDHYFIKSPHTDPIYLNEVDVIQSKQSRSDQRMILIMDSHYIFEIHDAVANIQLDDMKSVAESYYELAKTDEEILGILGYFWPSGFDLNSSIGARNMPPEVLDTYIKMGVEITGR